MSNTRIKKLSPLLINQLAAGEVVTRPAAVVKELLENAIDAGATDIEVRITQGGMGMIEVVDNGIGIHPDDMVMAITRHATSKVADVANLQGIMTLGFRGEALAATAAVSRLTLISSHDDSGIGRQLQVAGILADEPKLLPIVRTRGTTITVRDLYFNVPARRGNLKSIATEFSHIETIVREVALARADITLTLFHDNKKRLSLSASTLDASYHNSNRLPLSRLEQATTASLTDNAIEVRVDLTSLIQQSVARSDSNSAGSHASISGWLWPIQDQKDTAPKLIYVNGRLVKEALISNQLRQLAQSAQLAGIGYALYFDLPTEWLNINVHPSKQRIKISPLNNIMAHLSHALRPKLQTLNLSNTNKLQDKNAPNTDLSTDSSIDKTSSKASVVDSLTQSRQVQSPKQSYQLSEHRPLSTKAKSYNDKPYNDKSLNKEDGNSNVTLTSTTTALNESSNEIKELPHCLDIVTSLDGVMSESSFIQDSSDKTLPWLIFYGQGQCFIISAHDWRVKIGSLFESSVLNNSDIKGYKILNSAYDINQQLASISAQMTKQDLAVFAADIDTLLISHAIKTIDRNQLVALMLSSVHESPVN